MTPSFHIAQANWARMLAPIDDPVMADFVRALDPINALADASPGFVWRLQTEDGNATDIRAFEDERILFNMSVWETIDALREYIYNTEHAELLRDRARWFEPADRSPLALWWVPAGTLPDEKEGRNRLERLWQDGPTEAAFHFREMFPPPAVAREVPVD